MSGFLYMKGEEHRLISVELADHDDPWFVIPLAQACDQGFPVARIQPGADFERPTLPIAWIIILDDRAPEASGPSSFHAETLRWLFADASGIAVDAAGPQTAFYEYFVEEGMKGRRILVIRTVERRSTPGGSSRARTANSTASMSSYPTQTIRSSGFPPRLSASQVELPRPWDGRAATHGSQPFQRPAGE